MLNFQPISHAKQTSYTPKGKLIFNIFFINIQNHKKTLKQVLHQNVPRPSSDVFSVLPACGYPHLHPCPSFPLVMSVSASVYTVC